MNSNEGKLFYGIEPHIDPSSVVFYFHNVEDHNSNQLVDQYVVEIIVPPSYEKQLYFTGSNKAWIKSDGVKQQLRGTALVDYIKKNIL